MCNPSFTHGLIRSRCFIADIYPAGFHIKFCDFSLSPPLPSTSFFPHIICCLLLKSHLTGTRVALSNILNLNGNSINNKCTLSLCLGKGLEISFRSKKKKKTKPKQGLNPLVQEQPQSSCRGQLQIINCPFVCSHCGVNYLKEIRAQ